MSASFSGYLSFCVRLVLSYIVYSVYGKIHVMMITVRVLYYEYSNCAIFVKLYQQLQPCQ